MLSLAVVIQVPADLAGAAPRPTTRTGFSQPFAGTPKYEHLAPTQITDSRQLNQPIGQRVADEVAGKLGFAKADSFTEEQYRKFITGQGDMGDPAAARLLDESVRIFTNTTGRPLYSNVNGTLTPSVLAGYGLFVDKDGWLESLADKDAPTRRANYLIQPDGYMSKWCGANGAQGSLDALNRSAYPEEVAYGYRSQQISDPDQLVDNQMGSARSVVGMSMAPSIWIVNFLLLYMLNPAVAAEMPANWAPIPSTVVQGISDSRIGRVHFSEYASAFPNNGS